MDKTPSTVLEKESRVCPTCEVVVVKGENVASSRWNNGDYRCLQCTRIGKRQWEKRVKNKRVAKKRDESKEALTKIITLANKKVQNLPDIAEVMNRQVGELGGIDGWVGTITEILQEARTDENTSLWQEYRMHHGLMTLLLKANEFKGARRQTDDMDTDTLVAQIVDGLKQIAGETGEDAVILGIGGADEVDPAVPEDAENPYAGSELDGQQQVG